ncbi:hypothetical protein [Candidatus Harpocratesius sp.]
MVRRFVDSARLSRAKRIKSKDVLEFQVVKDNPVIAYCVIQGSESKPYIIIINCEEMYIAHWCYDYASGYGNCKHIAKLLLMLSSEQVDRIYQVRNELQKIRNRNIDDYLNEVKQQILLENPDNESISLKDRIFLLCQNFDSEIHRNRIIPSIISQIDGELFELPPTAKLIRIFDIMSLVSKDLKEKFLQVVSKPFNNAFKIALNHFLSTFWISHITNRLELLHYLVRASNLLQKPFSFKSLKMPSSVNSVELLDILILCELAFGSNQEVIFEKVNSNFKKYLKGILLDSPILHKRKLILHRMLEYHNSELKGLLHWLVKSSSAIDNSIHNQKRLEKVNSFFIYLLKSTGNTDRIYLNFDYGEEYSRYSTKTVQGNPCLDYIFSHIKQSGREYITYDEYHAYFVLFNNLEGNHDKNSFSEWIEKPRERCLDSVLPATGVIVQWDVNASLHHSEFLAAFENNIMLIIDNESPIASSLQPFDMTLCAPNFIALSPNKKKTYPQLILMPDQVVLLVKKGIKVISNILPWSVLTEFYSGIYVPGGRISLAIKQCIDFQFVFGALHLKEELEHIYRGSTSGISELMYKELRTKLIASTHRLNDETREICKKILFAEGPELSFFLNLLGNPIVDLHLKLIMKAAIAEEDIVEFRYSIIQSIFKELVGSRGFTYNRFKRIQEHTYGLYGFVPILLSDFFKKHISRLKTILKKGRKPTIKQLYANLFAQLYLREQNIRSNVELTAEQFQALQLKMESYIQQLN